MQVTISTPDYTHTTEIHEDALKKVRYTFNPSGLEDVMRIKLLSAAVISEAIALLEADLDEVAQEEAAAALHQMHQVQMLLVAATTYNA
jgi:hypothetical protein